jgi:hypothetical protein
VNVILTEMIEEIKLNQTQKYQRKHHQKLGKLIKKLKKGRRSRDRELITGK